MNYKKEVVAIAKNESAYLPLWCAHYTQLGFDKITIYLNGIDDHSYLILEKIVQIYPHVEIRNSDSYGDIKSFEYDYLIDTAFLSRNPMQSRAYAEAYVLSGKKGYDYILFVDIDEYLTPRKLTSKLDEVLAKYDEPEFLKFKWFNLATNMKEFAFPLSAKVEGIQSNTSKYLLKTNLNDVILKSTHMADTFNKKKRYLSGLGRILDYDKSDIESSIDSEFVLLHNMYRSEIEYLATLLRGDFIFKNSHGIKLNRKGWIRENNDALNIDPKVVSCFEENYLKLIQEAKLQSHVDIAQELIRIKASNLHSICIAINKEYKEIKKVLRGTSISL